MRGIPTLIPDDQLLNLDLKWPIDCLFNFTKLWFWVQMTLKQLIQEVVNCFYVSLSQNGHKVWNKYFMWYKQLIFKKNVDCIKVYEICTRSICVAGCWGSCTCLSSPLYSPLFSHHCPSSLSSIWHIYFLYIRSDTSSLVIHLQNKVTMLAQDGTSHHPFVFLPPPSFPLPLPIIFSPLYHLWHWYSLLYIYCNNLF